MNVDEVWNSKHGPSLPPSLSPSSFFTSLVGGLPLVFAILMQSFREMAVQYNNVCRIKAKRWFSGGPFVFTLTDVPLWSLSYCPL